MSDMKCPFCDNELERVYSRPFQLICAKCGSLGTDELWQELIRTRKALDVATKYIKHTQKVSPFWFNHLANETLDKIKTALEQKDK